MKIDYNKAIQNEEYARNIKINNDNNKNDYDNYIFIISAFYASGKYNEFVKKIIQNKNLFLNLIEDAEVIHCQSWGDSILEIAYRCNIVLNNLNFKTNKESREWVRENITRNLFFSKNLTFNKIIEIMSSIGVK